MAQMIQKEKMEVRDNGKEEREVEKICKRCKEAYKISSNTSSSCRFHPSFFVSRRHDDQIRYYELGPDDPPYAAKFYDCCGAVPPISISHMMISFPLDRVGFFL